MSSPASSDGGPSRLGLIPGRQLIEVVGAVYPGGDEPVCFSDAQHVRFPASAFEGAASAG